ncbi:AAA family ATPase [bacterium]|nr:AAA family ATPase [bacterium]
MHALASYLKKYVERHFAAALLRDPTASVRPVLIGPPDEANRELFSLLTGGGTHDWQVPCGGKPQEVIVLLVDSRETPSGEALSQVCNWDYAVSVRNSAPLVLMLASRHSWDVRPESLANTTETIGKVGTLRSNEDPLQSHLANVVADKIGLSADQATELLDIVCRDSSSLDPSSRDSALWEVINRLLSTDKTGSAMDDGSRATGLPVPGNASIGFQRAYQTLDSLSQFIAREGLQSAVQQMKATDAAKRHSVESDLDGLLAHLAPQLTSPTLMSTAPIHFYRAGPPSPQWYNSLSAVIIEDLLSELTQGTDQGRMRLVCNNALQAANPLRKGPYVVIQDVELAASCQSGQAPSDTIFTRKIDRTDSAQLAQSGQDPLRISDPRPPEHLKAIKYSVAAANLRPGTIQVISLDSFACGGLVVISGADRSSIPIQTRRSKSWSQELSISRGGATELTVYHSTTASRVCLSGTGETPICQQVPPGSPCTRFKVDIENNDEFHVEVRGPDNDLMGEWTLRIAVQEPTEISKSRLEALISEHRSRKGKCIPHAPDTWIHRLELGSYLTSKESWRPILACWGSKDIGHAPIQWEGTRLLGNIEPSIDPRPNLSPPESLLNAREAVRIRLHDEQRCISEIELDRPDLAPLFLEYLKQYVQWLEQDQVGASWVDVIALFAAEWNPQAGREIATDEPVVILLSPLHPLRLCWHAIAQRQLRESLELDCRCPAAGLLGPMQCPDASVLHLWNGNELKARSFFALPCEHTNWSVLINTSFLDKSESRGWAMRRLAELGLDVRTITGGFTANQTQDSLEEVAQLLPARATLRIGIVGDAEASSECGRGVLRWSEEQYAEDTFRARGCLGVEVFDTRGGGDPSPEMLANLSEITGEQVRWFRRDSSAIDSSIDLTIIDQLGVRKHEGIRGATRSAITPGGTFRIRIRRDFSAARSIVESRVASTRLTGEDLPELLARAIQKYEEQAALKTDCSQFRFIPNSDAIGSRLGESTYLSITSSQVDPACIVRGTIGQTGYMWNYELPGVLGEGAASSLGYYLVARPNQAMNDAISRAAALIVDPPPSVKDLLEEISRRGIPILKRLAAGGSQSRGELGLLLAARLLQDSFRGGNIESRLPVQKGECLHFVLPVDPYRELLSRLRDSRMEKSGTLQRPDLLVLGIQLSADAEPVRIKMTPVEVKFRAQGASPSEMRAHLCQAQNLGDLLNLFYCKFEETELWRTCTAALLSQILDFGFRIYGDPTIHQRAVDEWAEIHQRVLQDVLEFKADMIVNAAGRLLIFGDFPETKLADLDGDSRVDTLVISHPDARALLLGEAPVTQSLDSKVRQMDFSFPNCHSRTTHAKGEESPSYTSHPIQLGQAFPDRAMPEVIITDPSTPSDLETPPDGLLDKPDTTSRTHRLPGFVQAGTSVPQEVRQQVRDAFEGFIGNEPAIMRLTNDLLRALIEQPPHLAKNYLLTGLPSTGKTELARRVAIALGLPFIKLDGRGVSSRNRLFELINGELETHGLSPSQTGQQLGLPVLEYPPLTVFIDEVHLVSRAVQETLLTMLEAADRTVVLSDQVARVDQATFLFATTRASEVDAAFVSRCDEIQLREYFQDEVALMVAGKVRHDEWPEEVYKALATLGRCVPRIAIQLAEALETATIVAEKPKPLLGHLEDVRCAREMDKNGLTPMDFQYLSILERSKGPVGEQNILNLMRTVDKDRILNEVEPFLVRLRFIRHGPRGRELTKEGLDYLLVHRLNDR